MHHGQLSGQKLKENSNTEDKCTNYDVTKFNGIPKYGNTTIPIKSYKDQCKLHMIQNGMWDILYITDPRNAAKPWGSFTNQYIFTMSYHNRYIEDPRRDKKRADQYPYII